jgi:erythrocyte band 7 integral membrane protein
VIDQRTVSLDVPPQEILTKDSVTVAVDAVVYYKVENPMAAVVEISDYAGSTKLLAATSLRNILGTKSLADILSDREATSKAILEQIYIATRPWGILVSPYN